MASLNSTHSNILYEIKKSSMKSAHPSYQPNSADDELREENRRLRDINRSQETEIMRLRSTIDELKERIVFFESMNKVSTGLGL